MIYAYFLYVLSFFLLGAVMYLVSQSAILTVARVPLLFLAAFGLTHSICDAIRIGQLLEMSGVASKTPMFVDVSVLFLIPISWITLLCFGTELLIRDGRYSRMFRLLYLVLPALFGAVVLEAVMTASGVDWPVLIDNFSRVFLGLPSAVLSAYALWYVGCREREAHRRRYAAMMKAGAAMMLLFGTVMAYPDAQLPRNPMYPEHLVVYHPVVVAIRAVAMLGLTGTLSHCFIVEVTHVQVSLQRLREEVASLLAHDLRGLISSIQMSADILVTEVEKPGQDGEVKEIISLLSKNTKSLNRLVSDMFDVGLIDLRRVTLDTEDLDLGDLVTDACKLNELAIGMHKIKVNVPNDRVMVRADRARVGQILTNLLSNAGKYSSPSAEVDVEVKLEPGAAKVSVTSRGDPLSEQERSILFDRYYRTKSSRTKAQGAGLGLVIVKGLVEAHGGVVTVDSTPAGTNTFSFTLPVIGVAARMPARSSPQLLGTT